MLRREVGVVEEIVPHLTPAPEAPSPWEGPSLLADRVDQAVALAIDLPVSRRGQLRAALRNALEAEVAARRELGRSEDVAVREALQSAGSPRAFARRHLLPGERLRVADDPVVAGRWALGWFGGWLAFWIGAQYLSHASGMSWHFLAGEYDRTPEALSFLIWVALPAVVGARLGWRAGRAGWLAALLTLALFGFVAPGLLQFATGVPQMGEGEQSLLHEAAFWTGPICRAWLPIAVVAAGASELVRDGLRVTRAWARLRA